MTEIPIVKSRFLALPDLELRLFSVLGLSYYLQIKTQLTTLPYSSKCVSLKTGNLVLLELSARHQSFLLILRPPIKRSKTFLPFCVYMKEETSYRGGSD